jgi:hypothetical protein
VKFVALVSEKLPVDVALAETVHPPPALANETVWNGEFPGLTVSPASDELKRMVPEALLNEPPEFTNEPAIDMVPDGRTRDPFSMVSVRVSARLVSVNA